ncbi:MAG: energy transducer TonB [Bacteroidota bacterium]
MSNVSIFEKKWIDLVFEGKNKAYGAYQLRSESPRTTLTAFFVALLFIGSISGLGLFLSSFSTNPTPTIPDVIDDGGIHVVDVILEPNNPTTKPNTIPYSEPIIIPRIFTPIVTTTAQADSNIPTTPTSTPNGTVGEGTGTGETTGETGTSGGGTGEGLTTIPVETGPVLSPLLDEQPVYPGGIKKFYQYVGDNFERPVIDDVETISVNVSFVIEKDGSMTDIKVLRNPGYGLDKEAVRVLKSLKTKWKPGIKNGQYVRTQYTLPIKIQMN